jgi:spore coat protein U-like protein
MNLNEDKAHFKGMTTMASTTRKLSLATAAFAAAALFGAVEARAGTATSNLTVTATVPSVCLLTPGTLAFGSYDPVGANAATPLNASGTFTVACTKSTAYTVTLGLGANSASAIGTTRAMKDAGTGAFLSYEIYTATARTTVWNTTNTVGGTAASVAPITLTAYGQVPAGQNVPAAAGYTDTVVSTVNF